MGYTGEDTRSPPSSVFPALPIISSWMLSELVVREPRPMFPHIAKLVSKSRPFQLPGNPCLPSLDATCVSPGRTIPSLAEQYPQESCW